MENHRVMHSLVILCFLLFIRTHLNDSTAEEFLLGELVCRTVELDSGNPCGKRMFQISLKVVEILSGKEVAPPTGGVSQRHRDMLGGCG